jgi:NAD(P)-dependent dehydrogenase (short-subunit alcohol dehydrogenase family)
MEIAGKRVLVLGGSSGLGRAVGSRLAANGAHVAFAARRQDAVTGAASLAGNGAIGVTCDVLDASTCTSAVESVVERFGGLDALIYAAGVGALRRLADADVELWQHVLGTNVIGAAAVTRACLPHLEASSGRAVYFSSVSASLTPPWPGLGLYIVSKAALDKLVQAFAEEHPGVAFTRLVMGDSAGGEGPEMTEFANGFEPELFTELLGVWLQRGLVNGELVDVDQLARVVTMLLASDISVRTITVEPPPATPAG